MIRSDPNLLVDPRFVGIPYKIGGKSVAGADCIGVAVMWLETQGIHHEYDDGMGPVMEHWWEHNPQRFAEAMLKIGTMIRLSEVRKYDCLMFVLGNEGNVFPSCLGVMVDDRHFLVSTHERGSFVAMVDTFWKSKFWGAIRIHAAPRPEAA